ncbi:hypothetical protein [Alcanivorax sp. 1008]|uniref:hypothetical protein n=1 Tax=Alcanivorax sp. 1008 TaxID=2816853 RepID=UPI001D489917|nr:hypothetical protein [Alcanivorax sp. 1008]MCC1496384.1 DUF11 domain-containing protein [Alcanivorax sp. 1008]
MMMSMIRNTLLAFGLTAASMIAMAAPQISLQISAEKDVVEVDENGQQVTRRIAATDTVPGDVLFYTINYSNTGDEAARNVRLDNPVPEATSYQANSAWGENSEILFSIDGGKTFKKASNLTYQVTGTNGQPEDRQASPEQYNAIRWIIEEVGAGAQGSSGFSVVVQ